MFILTEFATTSCNAIQFLNGEFMLLNINTRYEIQVKVTAGFKENIIL